MGFLDKFKLWYEEVPAKKAKARTSRHRLRSKKNLLDHNRKSRSSNSRANLPTNNKSDKILGETKNVRRRKKSRRTKNNR